LNPLFTAALQLQSFCEAQNWRFCFIGGLAAQRWGEPRFTRELILRELKPLAELKQEPDIVTRLEALWQKRG
jgi:hypothetical protein